MLLVTYILHTEHADKRNNQFFFNASTQSVTTIDLNTRKEQFSKAYVRSVAVLAGADTFQPEVDRDSIDIILKKVNGSGEQLDIQLKCTADLPAVSGDLTYALKIKNYNDLRAATITKRILVVVYVPTSIDDWLEVSEDQMLLRKCGWWVDLSNEADSNNSTSVTVVIPRENIFTPEKVTELFDSTLSKFIAS